MKLKPMHRIVLICLNLFSIPIFAATGVSTASEASLIYTETKNNVVLQGKERTFTLRLKSNPTTGYQWFLRDYPSKLLLPIAHRFIPPETKLIGAGGVDEWKFKISERAASYPHQLVLRMIYARPSQGAEGSTSVVFRISTHP